MNEKRIKAIIQFRRGTSTDWEQINPILRVGEPGYATDLDKFKIGDGINEWNNLKWKDGDSEGGVVNADTHYDFPSVGRIDIIYKANKEGMLYQWIEEELKYKSLNPFDNIEIINGGNANGAT